MCVCIKQQKNIVHMIVSLLWCKPGKICVFFLDGTTYRPGWATVQTPTEPAVSCVRITRSVLCRCKLTQVEPFHRLLEVARRSPWRYGLTTAHLPFMNYTACLFTITPFFIAQQKQLIMRKALRCGVATTPLTVILFNN